MTINPEFSGRKIKCDWDNLPNITYRSLADNQYNTVADPGEGGRRARALPPPPFLFWVKKNRTRKNSRQGKQKNKKRATPLAQGLDTTTPPAPPP